MFTQYVFPKKMLSNTCKVRSECYTKVEIFQNGKKYQFSPNSKRRSNMEKRRKHG